MGQPSHEQSRQLPDLSVVLPAYREAPNLAELLPRLRQTLESIPLRFEILVIDTESPLDETEQVCRQHGAIYVRRSGGNDYGDAVRTGISAAEGRFCLFMDADGSHPPEFIKQLLAVAEHSDVVVASRYISGGGTDNSFVSTLMSRILNVTFSFVLGLRCSDISNSFKLYRTEMLQSIPLQCRNFDVIEEIMFRMQQQHAGLRIREVPFHFRKRAHGETKRRLLVFIMTFLGTMLRLRFSRSSSTEKSDSRIAANHVVHQPADTEGPVRKASQLTWFIVIGTVSACLYHLSLRWTPGYDQFPWNTFLFIPEDRFNDFRNIYKPFVSGLNPYSFRTYVYFPSLTLLMLPFQPLGTVALETFGLLFVSGFATLAGSLCRQTVGYRHTLTFIASLLISYPVLFSLDRANIECLLLLMILLAWKTRGTRFDDWGCLLLGWAGAIKLYPLLYLLPDLMNWRFRRLALTAGFAVATTMAGFLLVPGDNAQTLPLLSKNLQDFHTDYVAHGHGVHYNVSLLASVKAAAFFCSDWLHFDSTRAVAFTEQRWRMIVVVGLAGMLAAGWKLRQAEEWKSILVAVAAMLLLTPVSFDYKLLHLILPMLLFINSPRSTQDRTLTILFGLLMIPKAWLFVHNDISIAVILNPMLICLMLVVVLVAQSDRPPAANSTGTVTTT
jgi:dolichol-phosphate mannosyltransferase